MNENKGIWGEGEDMQKGSLVLFVSLESLGSHCYRRGTSRLRKADKVSPESELLCLFGSATPHLSEMRKLRQWQRQP